jgi:hypothetical protein
MSIALSAVLLILLLVPGFLFRDRYRRSFRPNDTRGVSLFFADASAQALGRPSREALHVAFMAALLNVALCAAATSVSHATSGAIPQPNLKATLLILVNSFGPDDRYFDDVVSSVVDRPGWILGYFAALYTAALFAGVVCCWVVRRWGLDRSWNLLEFANPWVRLLVGDTPAVDDKLDELTAEARARVIVLTSVSAAVCLEGAAHLYFGFLSSVHLDADGGIDHIVLWQTHRRHLKPDETDATASDERDHYYPIRGDYVAVKYSEIRNLNVDYVFVFEDEDAPEGASDHDAQAEPAQPWNDH